MRGDDETFGPYELHECLGAGGMATVHRASIELSDGARREVAIKRLLPQLADDRGFVEDFIREAKLVAGLEHPHIVKLLELGCVGRTYYIVMELVKGVSLMALMRAAYTSKRAVPIGVALALLSELCDALDYASNGTDAFGEPLRLVHRDLSPSNLLVTDQGSLKVIDFGVAKAVSGTRFLTDSGLVKGKLAYMAPEALSDRPIDSRADLFSAGVVAWELLTARRLLKADTQDEVIEKLRTLVIQPPSTYNPRCPPALDAVVLRALARPVSERWVSAAAMREAIEEVRRDCRDPSTPRAVTDWMRGSAIGRKPTLLGLAFESASEISPPRLSTDELSEIIDSPPMAPRPFRLMSPAWRSSVLEDVSKEIEIGILERKRITVVEDPSKQIQIEVPETTQDRAEAIDEFDGKTTASAAPAFLDDDDKINSR